jgi:PAS domain-containing protein
LAFDGKDKVVLWNRAAELFFGESSSEAIGKTLARVVGRDAAQALKAVKGKAGVGKTTPITFGAFDGPRQLDVECLPAAAPWAALFLGTELASPQGAAAVRAVPTPRPRRQHLSPAGRLLAQQDLNEELQSRNEELETVNEELQSLNEELSAMEEELRGLGEVSQSANNFLTLLLDTSPDVLIACDADNRVSFWSKAAVQRYRLSPAQAIGADLFDLVPALADAPLQAAAVKARKAGRGLRVAVMHEGVEHVFDPLPATPGKRRGYLLRVLTSAA